MFDPLARHHVDNDVVQPPTDIFCVRSYSAVSRISCHYTKGCNAICVAKRKTHLTAVGTMPFNTLVKHWYKRP